MANQIQIQIQIEMPHLRGTFEGRRFAVVAREHRKTGIYVLICFSDGTSTTVPESALVYEK